MNPLAERFSGLASLPHVSLTSLPTALVSMPHASAALGAHVWVKRDDACAVRYGGNKARKLEWILGEARRRGADTLVTTGAAGSHHVFATSLYGRELGMETHAVLLPQPWSPHVEAQLRATLAIGTRVTAARSYPQLAREVGELVLKLKLWGQRPYVIPPGGSSIRGTLGYVVAGLELAQQLDAGQARELSTVYVACGTSATVAGLALGLYAGGATAELVAVRIGDGVFANRLQLRRLLRGAQKLLNSLDARFPDVADRALAAIRIDDVEVGKGHGFATPSSEAACILARQDGLELEPTYTAKTFSCLMREARGRQAGKTLLFVHTFSSTPLEPFLVGAPLIPDVLAELVRR